MLCSISTAKSGSKWLDRLRSSKGFPASNDLDLEQFLNQHNPDLSNSLDTKASDANIGPKLNSRSAEPSEKPTETPRENGEKEWFGIMNNVLAELFYMGDANDFPKIHGKKISRKQPNPKLCVLSTLSNVESGNDDIRRDGGVLATIRSSGDNSVVKVTQTSDPLRLTKEENVDVDAGIRPLDVEEDEKCHADLSAFSHTEVTVIDTSYETWKFEKLLFRKKNLWRVREKKNKSMNIGIKKRKANPLEDETAGREKKPKRCTSSKYANVEENMTPSKDVDLQNDKMNRDCEETPDILRQVRKKRFPRKSKECGSSVILDKSAPTSKKNGANIPLSCLKLTQRQ